MAEPTRHSYPRYLTAKKPVDARALNRRVWNDFLNAVDGPSRLRVLEVGGGVGATVERVVAALEERSIDALHYSFVDVRPENVDTAISSLQAWAERRGYQVSGHTEQLWSGEAMEVSIDFITADLFDVHEVLEEGTYDAIVSQAVLDLLPLSHALRALQPLLREGGLWYLPLHFDGVTGFEPPLDSSLDASIEQLYHESMSDAEEERHGARSGRALLRQLPHHDAQLLSAGSSDWVVFPKMGGYPNDEAYFLHHILHFIEAELSDHPALDAEAFANWVQHRRQQVEDGTLIYVAHQLDVLARQNSG